ncbi:hypothetical protein AX17_007181, partial [Amanita inopinata Kibby_2008]
NSPPTSRRSSLLPPPATTAVDGPSSRPATPQGNVRLLLTLAPPVQRFLECAPDDLRISEVGELLREYRRLVEAVRAVGGFDEV